MPTDVRTSLKSNFRAIFDSWKQRTADQSKSRIAFANEIGLGDGTLGRIQYGAGNTTLEVLIKLGEYAKVEPWQLLAPEMGAHLAPRPTFDDPEFAELAARATPRSRDALIRIAEAAAEGLDEKDVELLVQIAQRFKRPE